MSPGALVLWDLDLTLLDAAGFGHRVIEPELAALLGRPPRATTSFAGRTDAAILAELLALEGCDGPPPPGSAHDSALGHLMSAVARRAEREIDSLRGSGGGPLPGARELVAALALVPGVHQGVVTGNMRAVAELKIAACGFDGHLDLGLAAFGDTHHDRAHLVAEARDAAAARGISAWPESTVVVGDTVHDIRGALDAGVRAVGVASGRVSRADLIDAGAHAVLDELTDPAAARAIFGGRGALAGDTGSLHAIVLAGGGSRRFGADKLAAPVGDSTLLGRVISAARGVSDRVVVAGPAERGSAASIDPASDPAVVFAGEDPPGGGPVAGIAAALDRLPSDGRVMLLAGDLVAPAGVTTVLSAAACMGAAATDALLLADPSGRSQYLAGYYDLAALRRAVAALGERGRDASLRGLTGHLRLDTLTVPAELVADVDTREDLALLERPDAWVDAAGAVGAADAVATVQP